jgi:copper resistance protein B
MNANSKTRDNTLKGRTVMKYFFKQAAAVVLVAGVGMQLVYAEDAKQVAPGMDHGNMQGMDHGATPNKDSGMSGMDMGSMQGGKAPPDARDPHANSGGYTLDSGPYVLPAAQRLRLADEHKFGSLLVDRLEAVQTGSENSAAYDLQAWFGRDYDRAVIKAEGHYESGVFAETSTELLWSHAVSAYWNRELGLRYDGGQDPSRTWLAFGFQGLAPYWFEVDATAYVGEGGRTALGVEAEYETLFTQKLILQTRVETSLYGQDDAARSIGSGLSELTAGVRLRYEIRRQFAPYVGVEWTGKFGGTADYAAAAGKAASETKAVAGLRFWF